MGLNKVYIGIDNGVTGTISILKEGGVVIYFKMPIKRELSYTKKKQYITRLCYDSLNSIIEEYYNSNCFCLIERPMINPKRWKASMSAIRALESALIVLENNVIPYQYLDSKEWQKEFLPKGIKKPSILKNAAIDVARRLFPQIETKDADSLLIAEYARRKGL